MTPGITIAQGVTFPPNVATQTLAAIGRRGAGKTYLATMLAEQMIDAGIQIVVIDPVGNWYGLRIAGAGPGRPIVVFGGEHGDRELTALDGADVARLVVATGMSVVLDVSLMRTEERIQFAGDFAEELFELKKRHRSPLHVFIEEAQVFCPQRLTRGARDMGDAFESIIRLGRNYGLGATLITQRPQSVNKEVLSQVECLMVLQVNGRHERKALEEWIQEAGADRDLIDQLPGLERGEGYVWSPSWLRMFQRVRFARKTTFDASATPTGEAPPVPELVPVEIPAMPPPEPPPPPLAVPGEQPPPLPPRDEVVVPPELPRGNVNEKRPDGWVWFAAIAVGVIMLLCR